MEDSAKWEYVVLSFGGLLGAEKDEKIQATLNDWGAEGWEVVSAIALDNSSKIKVIARRPLSSITRRQRTFPS